MKIAQYECWDDFSFNQIKSAFVLWHFASFFRSREHSSMNKYKMKRNYEWKTNTLNKSKCLMPVSNVAIWTLKIHKVTGSEMCQERKKYHNSRLMWLCQWITKRYLRTLPPVVHLAVVVVVAALYNLSITTCTNMNEFQIIFIIHLHKLYGIKYNSITFI